MKRIEENMNDTPSMGGVDRPVIGNAEFATYDKISSYAPSFIRILKANLEPVEGGIPMPNKEYKIRIANELTQKLDILIHEYFNEFDNADFWEEIYEAMEILVEDPRG